LGFLASDCKKYIGTEPSTKSFKGLSELKETYDYVNKKVELYCMGSEKFIPEESSIDLCFTSPPYFDTEQYSQEETQSFKAYPTKELWLNDFLRQTIKNCKFGLKESGYMIINISNTKNSDWIEQEMIKLAKIEGFKLVNTYYLVLSSIAGNGKKREPVFIFQLIATPSDSATQVSKADEHNISLKESSSEDSQISSNDETSLNNNIRRNF